VRLGPSTPGDYVRARVLAPLKLGCDTMAGVLVLEATIQGVRTHNMASQAKILRTYVITFCSQANVITFPYKRDPSSISAGMDYAAPAGVTLEASSGQPHQRRRPPLHRRIAGNSDHLCTSSDNNLRAAH
jgi:hypothetical protein